jgi:hypothetical protein
MDKTSGAKFGRHMIKAASWGALFLGVMASRLWAQDAPCTGANHDTCVIERLDKDLSYAIDSAISQLDQLSTDQERVRQAKSFLLEAQSEWLHFREVECRARAAANIISARTRTGLIDLRLYIFADAPAHRGY